MTDIHIIYTEAGDEYGWTIESPQIPELIGGRSTSEELLADTEEIIDWAREDGSAYDTVYAHEQHLVRAPDGLDFLIRWQFNDEENYASRLETAGRLNHAVTAGLITPGEWGEHAPLAVTGERLYIAVVSTDKLGWVQDQLSDRDSACVLAEHLEDGAVVHLPFAQSGVLRTGLDIELLGLNRESTFGAMVDAVVAREVDALKKTFLPKQPNSIPRLLTRV